MIWVIGTAAIFVLIVVLMWVSSRNELAHWNGKGHRPGLVPGRNDHEAQAPPNLGIPDGYD
jgi:hypothetical protein